MMNIVVFTQKLRWYQIRITGNNRENKKGTLKRDFFKLAPIKCCLNKNGIFLLFIHNEWDLWLKYYFIHCKTKQSWICMYIYSQMVKQKPWHCTSPSILKAVENNQAETLIYISNGNKPKLEKFSILKYYYILNTLYYQTVLLWRHLV